MDAGRIVFDKIRNGDSVSKIVFIDGAGTTEYNFMFIELLLEMNFMNIADCTVHFVSGDKVTTKPFLDFMEEKSFPLYIDHPILNDPKIKSDLMYKLAKAKRLR